MSCAADDDAAAYARLANNLAYELQIHGIGGGRQLGPPRFDELEAPAGVGDEINFTRAIAPEEESARPAGPSLAVPTERTRRSCKICDYIEYFTGVQNA